MAKIEKPDEENLEEKARELWGDPERELDEYDLELARLQNELDGEEAAAQEAAEQAARERAAAEKAARAEAAEDEDPEDSGEELAAPDEEEPIEESAGSLADRGKRKISEAADQAAQEVAAEAMKGGNVKDAALTVVKRRLPGLPSRTQFRNGALGVAGAGVGLWLLWGILAPVFGWAWWLAKWGLVGGVGYGAYRTYQMLPDRGASDDDAATTDEEPED